MEQHTADVQVHAMARRPRHRTAYEQPGSIQRMRGALSCKNPEQLHPHPQPHAPDRARLRMMIYTPHARAPSTLDGCSAHPQPLDGARPVLLVGEADRVDRRLDLLLDCAHLARAVHVTPRCEARAHATRVGSPRAIGECAAARGRTAPRRILALHRAASRMVLPKNRGLGSGP
eukprot:4697815-Prymnesium_polylepis.1